MRRITSWVVSAAAALSGVGLSAGPALAATELTCGATVSGEVELTRDLRCADGITVEGSATIELNGHSLVGPGAEVAGSIGIKLSRNWAEEDRTVVRGGRISGWATGISGIDLAERLTLTGNQTGISSYRFEVRSSVVSGNRDGVYAYLGQVVVVGSTFRGNRVAVGGEVSTAIVSASTFVDNQRGVDVSEGSVRSTGNVFRRSGTAVVADWNGGAVSSGDRYIDNGTAFTGSSLSIGTVDAGTFIGNDVGVQSDGVLFVTGSTFTGNEMALDYLMWTRDDNPVARVAVEADGGTISGNRFRRNGDALHTVTKGVKVTGNTATDNDRWGIYAPDAIDGGGNRARRNGNEPQCTGVVCS